MNIIVHKNNNNYYNYNIRSTISVRDDINSDVILHIALMCLLITSIAKNLLVSSFSRYIFLYTTLIKSFKAHSHMPT